MLAKHLEIHEKTVDLLDGGGGGDEGKRQKKKVATGVIKKRAIARMNTHEKESKPRGGNTHGLLNRERGYKREGQQKTSKR